MKSSVTSTLLLICIISITVSCFVSFTQAEGLKIRYNAVKRVENTTHAGSTTGGSYTTGISGNSNSTHGNSTQGGSNEGGSNQGNSTTGGSLTSGGIGSGNSTNSTSTGALTSGGVGISTGTTSGSTTSAPEIVIIVIVYRCKLDPTTFNKTAAAEGFAAQLGVSVASINITFVEVTAKRAVNAVGNYDLTITVTTLSNTPGGQLNQADLNKLANSTALRDTLAKSGVTDITGVVATATKVSSTTTGLAVGGTTTGDGSNESSGLSAGAIAGIVIGVVAVVAIVVAAIIITKRKSKKNTQVQPLINGNNGPHYP